jgi:protein TonB
VTRRAATANISGPLLFSAVLHGAALSWLLLAHAGESRVSLPPMYKVELIAAPPGPPAVGVVTDEPAPVKPPKPEPAKSVPKPAEKLVPLKNAKTKTVPTKAPPKATPVPTPKSAKPATTAPRAGGGAEGGAGADVANVRTEGIDFPFPGYLQNIVRQVRLNFSPSDKSLRTAEVFFLIRRDGTMSGFRFLQKSGSYAFDLECQGAVEAAAAAKAWGPLPAGFLDDVLPVIFRFDPKTLR